MLSYLFPKGSLGIEITTKYVRFVHMVKKNSLFHIQDFGRISIPPHVFLDGALQDISALQDILQSIVRHSHVDQIRLSIPGEGQKFITMTLPDSSTETLVDDIVFYLKEKVLFHQDVDELADVRIVDRGNASITVRSAVMPVSWYKSIKPALRILRRFNIHLTSSYQAAISASLHVNECLPRIHIQFGDDTSSCSVLDDKGRVVRHQDFPLSTHRFLIEVQKKLTKPSDIASNYLSHLGVLGADVREFSEDTLRSVAFLVDHMIVEYGRDTGKTVQDVSIGGVLAGYRGVNEILSKYLRMRVTLAYPWKTSDSRFDDSIFEMKKQESLEYLPALGLALDGMK